MLTVTETAASRLRELLNDRHAVADDKVVRIVRREGRLRFRLDHAQPDDTTHVHDGRTLLVYDRVLSGSLAHRTLDVRATKTGARLSLVPR